MGRSREVITVFYDGSCPRCVHDRQRYERLAGAESDSVCWLDISGCEAELEQLGVDPKAALLALHVRDQQQQIHVELDAYILLMERVPMLRPLAWVVGLPVIRPWLSILYRWSVRRRLSSQGRLP